MTLWKTLTSEHTITGESICVECVSRIAVTGVATWCVQAHLVTSISSCLALINIYKSNNTLIHYVANAAALNKADAMEMQ